MSSWDEVWAEQFEDEFAFLEPLEPEPEAKYLECPACGEVGAMAPDDYLRFECRQE